MKWQQITTAGWTLYQIIVMHILKFELAPWNSVSTAKSVIFLKNILVKSKGDGKKLAEQNTLQDNMNKLYLSKIDLKQVFFYTIVVRMNWFRCHKMGLLSLKVKLKVTF